VPIGRWVLREACRQLRRWDGEERGPERLMVSVNVSARELREVDFAEHVATALRETGLAPRRLAVEITESVLVKGTESTRDAPGVESDRRVHPSRRFRDGVLLAELSESFPAGHGED
jgi:predicted signal transduction protein with EAL and GGDEF domain